MVSNQVLNGLLILGPLLIAGLCPALAYPASAEDDEMMMQDDYDYGHDEVAPASQQAKAKLPSAMRNLTVTGILGEEVVLKCDQKITKENVVLWYHESKIISNGGSLVQPNFSLDPVSYDLTILKASPQNAGNYYCQVEPHNIVVHTHVVLGDHSLDVIVPESSKSGQSRLNGYSLMGLLFALLLLQQHKN